MAFSLPEIVYRELRNAILNGVFQPGQVLRQEDVAVRLGVSRSPLREALPRLEAEGIVVLNPRRGYSVATLESSKIKEAFDLRILLECEIGRHAIARRTDADVASIHDILRQMATMADKAETADRTHWFELNTSFHLALLKPAGMPLHMQALHTARGIIEAYVRAEVRFTGDLEHAQTEHGLMCAAFAARDTEVFLQLLSGHANNTRIRLLEGMARAASLRFAPPLGAQVPGLKVDVCA